MWYGSLWTGTCHRIEPTGSLKQAFKCLKSEDSVLAGDSCLAFPQMFDTNAKGQRLDDCFHAKADLRAWHAHTK